MRARPSPSASLAPSGGGRLLPRLPSFHPPHSPILAPSQQDDFEVDVLPFALVSTIDGALHAIDRETGEVKWTLRDGVEPLVGGGIYGRRDDVEYIVEPVSGNLYVFEGENEGSKGMPKVRKLPYSVEQLIELAPFTFPHSPNRIFTGIKETSLLSLDLRTGQQLDCFNARGPFDTPPVQSVCDNDILDDLEGRPRDTLFIGRTDYKLMIHAPPTAVDKPSVTATMSAAWNRGVQEITYSTYQPNSYDRTVADFWARTGRQSWADEGRIRIELGFDGDCIGVQNGQGQRWYTDLGSVGVAVYDVVLSTSSHSSNPVIVPQPKVELASLLMAPDEGDPKRERYEELLRKPPTTYIGSVPFDSTLDNHVSKAPKLAAPKSPRPLLFAQSSNSYPLIHFAHAPRPGTLINGSFPLMDGDSIQDVPEDEHHITRYLIDPPRAASSTIPPPPSEALLGVASGWVFKWWWLVILEVIAVFWLGIGIYRWAFTKATALANSSAKTDETASLLSATSSEKGSVTTGVRFEGLPDTGSATPAEGSTPPKKKGTRRRVRGKKKRRNSVGPQLDRDDDDGDDDDEDKGDVTADERPNGLSFSSGPNGGILSNGYGSNGTAFVMVEKPLPAIPRSLSTPALQDEQERLAISDTVIGYGSHGTVVLKGTWGGRPVAVKRLLSDFVRLASQEVKLLQASDDHPNVIRYYCQERRDNFLYIALDLCQASLADLIETPNSFLELASALDHKKALQQITSGVKHLHSMKIIHRDIKPQNVLVSKAKNGSLRMLVSDFGLARRLEQGQSSFAPTANNLAGSLGWRAPECIRGQVKLNEGFDPVLSCGSTGSTASSTGSLPDLLVMSDGSEVVKGVPRARLTKAVDLFALGCLYFWILMSGEHPYGETYNREANIVKGDAVNMEHLSILGEEGVEAQHLIGQLLSAEPSERPDTSECLIHPFFWTSAKRLAFLCDASDRFEIMEPEETTLALLEKNADQVVGKNWYSKMDRVFTSSLGKYRKYRGESVRDLLRAMRNKKHHYQDMDPSAQKHMGALPAGFLNYFTTKFPKLFLHVHGVVRDSRLRSEPMFATEYFIQEKE
ncbi:hypothetical protein CcaverHIS002_0507910 [Cutaneotrichosporon cavernicola]|nr:hypothetical protein CcaverHIS002_0507910 [Cutaneotrichosporon cavernicola]